MAVEAPPAPARIERPLLVADRPDIEIFARLEAEELIHSAGVLALQKTVEFDTPKARRYNNLREATQAANAGDALARPFVHANVSGEFVEQVYKKHIRKVSLEVDADGDISQNGQKISQMYVYGLAFGVGKGEWFERGAAETRFGARLTQAHHAGLLKNNYLLYISRYSDKMTDKEAAEAHLFVDAKSCSIQVVSEDENGIALEAAFVAGAKERGGARHDRKGVAYMGHALGVELDGDATETMDNVVLVPKEFAPNGIVDFLKLYDQGVGDTFMGDAGPAMDYQEFYELCRQREADLEANMNEVTDLLIANADTFVDYMDPLHAMRDMVKERLVGYIIANPDMDDNVYGAKAQVHIRKGRAAYAAGDAAEALRQYHKAVAVADPTGCPIFDRKHVMAGESSDDHDDLGSRHFLCPKGHSNYRRVANVPETSCRICGTDVGCKEPPKATKTPPKHTTKARIIGTPERYGNVRAVRGVLSLAGA